MTCSITTLNTRHSIVMLSVTCGEYQLWSVSFTTQECCYVECRYAECRSARTPTIPVVFVMTFRKCEHTFSWTHKSWEEKFGDAELKKKFYNIKHWTLGKCFIFMLFSFKIFWCWRHNASFLVTNASAIKPRVFWTCQVVLPSLIFTCKARAYLNIH